ncbi:MAG: adenylate/guanylate cyclase domain-containing protein [Spirochaetia bacterium]
MNFDSIQNPVKANFLVGFADLSKFGRITAKMDDAELFDLLTGWYELAGDLVSSSGGQVVKCIDDALLIVYPEDKCDEGVLGLIELQEKSEQFFQERNINTKLKMTAHFGEAVMGKTGIKGDKHLDILGKTVNTAAMLETQNGFAMTAAAFRSLSPEPRKKFKKHTPPITYIPVEERHRD